MPTHKILPRQTLADAVLQATGSMEGHMAICKANGLSPSANPPAGTVLIIPSDVAVNSQVLEFITAREIVIGTLAGMPVSADEGLLSTEGDALLSVEGDELLPTE